VDYSDAIATLRRALNHPLPGAASHDLLVPRPPRPWPPGFDLANIRHAAALLLIVPIEDRAHAVLTVRSAHLARHSGQVALPGGAMDAGETCEQAALREAREEVGLDSSLVQMLGRLSPVDIPVSGFRLHPVLACAAPRPSLRPADGEVERIVDVPLGRLLDRSALTWTGAVRDNQRLDIPCFEIADTTIWGATAMVMAECLTLLGWTPAGR
jgi:8-oxo-dGTP pyrophosphatase MutT (NUDIX family)